MIYFLLLMDDCSNAIVDSKTGTTCSCTSPALVR
jgi:hypothetical protein